MDKIEIACRMYRRGKSTYEIGKALGMSYESVRVRLHRGKVRIRTPKERNRKYRMIDRCFQKPTVKSFYYAGLLMSDGNIARNSNMVQIELNETDSYLLEGLKKFSKYEGNIEYRKKTQRSGFVSKMVMLRMTSSQMVKDLALFGIIPNKSKNGKIPKWVNKHPLAEFFFRGIFDGDGCVGIRNGKFCTGLKFVTFCGNISVVDSFRSWINKKIGIMGGLSKRKNGIRVVNYSYGAVSRVGWCLYGDKRGPRLNRKKNIFIL